MEMEAFIMRARLLSEGGIRCVPLLGSPRPLSWTMISTVLGLAMISIFYLIRIGVFDDVC